MIRFALLLLLWPVAIAAQPYPALHDVAGVAADDVLNVRVRPSASAPIVGSLPPNATDIEVVQTNAAGTWGQVNIGEQTGWTSMRYLQQHDPNPDYALAQRLSCFGTEPFWSLDLTQGQQARFRTPETDFVTPGVGLMLGAKGRSDIWGVAFSNSTAIFQRANCSDGMSDRNFGLTVRLYLFHEGVAEVRAGCCSILMH